MGNTCLGHHQIAGGAHGNPGWGTGNQGVADAGYLDWVLCCGGNAEPAWFDGSDPAWTGTTWGAGVDFCNAQNMELCPYEIYCPDGPANPPLGGTKPGDMWSPMSDGTNRWVQVGVWAGNAGNTCLGHHEIAGGVHGDPAWGMDGSRHGFMTYILCCPLGTAAALAPPAVPPPVFSGDWLATNGAYNSWGAAVDWCIAQGAEDLCPYEVYCPDGGGSAPFNGRRVGRTGDDQWAPFGGDGENRWVQTGIWGGDLGNTCLGHHQIAGGVHGNPGWGTGNQGVADAGYLDWVLCCVS